ncbi:hypothetical protein [Mesorhizobium sp. ANAO-SY3R2]|uniref:hypothetical protein n=1 Tax=Mesorhizobium sp. ANAO-SY3R2 TaxID=3166644 RepID=UPI00366BDF5A
MTAADLFGPIERGRRIVRMHAVDHGLAPSILPGWKTPNGGHFKCRCGHDAGWLFNLSDTEIRRGLPCPNCNEAKND